MNNQLGHIFTEALAEIIAQISGFTLDVLPLEKEAGFDEMVGFMSLNSKKSGILSISANQDTMRMLCSFIIGISKDEVTQEDIEDALCELVNMTAGSVKLRLNDEDYAFTLTTPFVISGKDLAIHTKKRANIISAALGNGEMTIKLNIIY